jgi:hypothetical protein
VTNTDKPTPMRLYRPHKFAGVAWFQRTIEGPPARNGRRVHLFLERCHWETQVWVDKQYVGMQDSLCIAHEYDLGMLSPGPRRLTIRDTSIRGTAANFPPTTGRAKNANRVSSSGRPAG